MLEPESGQGWEGLGCDCLSSTKAIWAGRWCSHRVVQPFLMSVCLSVLQEERP